MSRVFIDANILIYFCSGDSVHKDASLEFIQGLVNSKDHGVVNDYVLNEAHYVLSHEAGAAEAHKLLKELVDERYNIIFEDTNFSLDDVLKSFEICEKYNFKVTDAYHAYFCKKNKIKKIATFDAHFKRIPWLSVVTS